MAFRVKWDSCMVFFSRKNRSEQYNPDQTPQHRHFFTRFHWKKGTNGRTNANFLYYEKLQTIDRPAKWQPCVFVVACSQLPVSLQGYLFSIVKTSFETFPPSVPLSRVSLSLPLRTNCVVIYIATDSILDLNLEGNVSKHWFSPIYSSIVHCFEQKGLRTCAKFSGKIPLVCKNN